MQGLTEDGRRLVEAAASRHGFSTDAVVSLLMSLAAGGGRQAQFNHWEFGGMGQWSQGGMIMIGDMFNNGLKYRVDALCNELSAALQEGSPFAPAPAVSRQNQIQSGQSQSSQSQSGGGGGTSFFVPGSFGNRWPAELGQAASTGSQNDLHYAVFPATRRLALDQNGHVTVYDTGDHVITGFSQQQGGGQSITFTSQHGLVRLIDLPQVPTEQAEPAAHSAPAAPVADMVAAHVPEPLHVPGPAHVPDPAPVADPAMASPPAWSAPAEPRSAAISDDEIFSRLERLAELRSRDIITAAEFDAKKAELLARL